MKVEVLVDHIKHNGERVEVGTVIEVNAQTAQRLIDRGEAKKAASKAPSKGKQTASKAPSKAGDE